MKKLITIMLLIIPIGLFAATSRVEIREARGRYQINFEATYVIYVNLDIETAIMLPEGYTFIGEMSGSRDFISVGAVQNTIYISKSVNHPFVTNAVLHVLTPEQKEERLIFEIVGGNASPKIYAIQFDKPNSSELNRTVETIKSRYSQEMTSKLSEQEVALKESVREKTLKESLPVFFNCHRDDIEEDYKGAKVYLEGMINNDGDSYVYLKTNATKQKECDVIRLLSVQVGKEYNAPATLVTTVENEDGTFSIVYKLPALPLKGKKLKAKFNIEIWSKTFTLTQNLS